MTTQTILQIFSTAINLIKENCTKMLIKIRSLNPTILIKIQKLNISTIPL